MLTDFSFPKTNTLAVGFSGGGDSTALLSLIIKRAPKGVKIHALIVDHALRAGSGREAALAKRRAIAMGAQAQILIWQGLKPNTALQEKARVARYGLLGGACRELGIDTLLLGHNEDDQAETIMMRTQSGSSWRGLAGMTEHKIAPIWPQLRGINIVRPLLGQSRAALRAYNRQNKMAYIDDPSNENRSFTRVQMRHMLSEDNGLKIEALAVGVRSQKRLTKEKLEVAAYIKLNTLMMDWGGVYLTKSALSSKARVNVQALRVLILAVSGQAYFAQTAKLENLEARMRGKNFKGATLGGAQIINARDKFLLIRDKGMALGRGEIKPLKPMPLAAGQSRVWDGRLLVQAGADGIAIIPNESAQKQCEHRLLPKDTEIPSQARPTLPASIKNNYAISYQSLVPERLKALLS